MLFRSQQSKLEELQQQEEDKLKTSLGEMEKRYQAQKKMIADAAANRKLYIGTQILEIENKITRLTQEADSWCADFHVLTQLPNGQPAQQPMQAPEAAPNATLIPVAPGNILHSNSVNHAELAAGMANSPGFLELGLTTEQLQGIAALSVENLLCQLNANPWQYRHQPKRRCSRWTSRRSTWKPTPKQKGRQRRWTH